jgi:hypothetical protein
MNESRACNDESCNDDVLIVCILREGAMRIMKTLPGFRC